MSIGAATARLLVIAAPSACSRTVPAVASSSTVVANADSVAHVAHDSFTVHSGALSEDRLVNVHVPAGQAADARLPVLYMPDGGLDEDFPHVVAAVDSLIARRAIRPVIVVGVPNTQRRRDLTPPTRVASDSAIAKRVGGSAAFRRFLVDELRPMIERRYRVTGERGIIGESLAGLFVMETLLESPSSFTHYIALDPSLWWDRGALVESAGARLTVLDAAVRTLYVASSLEPSTAVPVARLAGMLRASPPRGLRWSHVPRPDLTHGNMFQGLETAALADAFR